MENGGSSESHLGSSYLKSILSPMSHRQDHHLAAVVAVERDVTARAKADRPFPKGGLNIFGGASGLGVGGQQADALANGLDGARRRAGVFGFQERMQARHIV